MRWTAWTSAPWCTGSSYRFSSVGEVSTTSKPHSSQTPKSVLIETPTNPVMILTDLKEISEIAHRAGARVVCDNTFMSPYLQRPLEFGVDIVVHSTTKYLNGHSDGVGGVVVLNDEEDANWIGFVQNSAGAILSPFDSWLVIRGTKTLALVWNSTTNRDVRSPRSWKSIRRYERFIIPARHRIRSMRGMGSNTVLAAWWLLTLAHLRPRARCSSLLSFALWRRVWEV